jgi:hypothetical protein
MRQTLYAFLALICLGIGNERLVWAADPYMVGEAWVYQHEGNRSSGDMSIPFNGERIREILSTGGENENQYWVLAERWGAGDLNPVKFHVDGKKMLREVDASSQIISIKPPVPFCWSDLKTGEEKDFESMMAVSGYSSPIQFHVKRLTDETITVPAGEFKDCAKIETLVTMSPQGAPQSAELKISYTYWYHPKANGFVKESFQVAIPDSGPSSAKTLSGTSQLKSHEMKKKEQ